MAEDAPSCWAACWGCLGVLVEQLNTCEQKTLLVLCLLLILFGCFNGVFGGIFIFSAIIGIVTVVLSCIGIFGTWRRNRKALGTFGIGCFFLVVFDLIELGMDVWQYISEGTSVGIIAAVLSLVFDLLCIFMTWRVYVQCTTYDDMSEIESANAKKLSRKMAARRRRAADTSSDSESQSDSYSESQSESE
eukprot:TRINITY_DN4472_c0_g2_i2.p1 TRINITY_DN4472_c0_g2~~TRINITY_DN4472_c0_g2_i2.p1  ORF type:complete len:190 (+),score=28.19 TRINITY_DN4472_c0_g2_i2:257-826(+)